MACNVSTRNLGPRNVLLGKNTLQTFCLTAKADVSSSLNNTYFVIHEAVTQTKHYFWFNVATTGVDPVVPNATAHPIPIAVGASASAVATAIASVVDPLTWVSAVATADHVDFAMVAAMGYAFPIRDSTVTANKTLMTFVVVKYGSIQADLGGTEGDVKMKLTEKNVDVKAPQTGNFVTSQIRQGIEATVSFSLQDTSVASIRRVLNFYGSTLVPDNGSGKVLTGYGSDNLFKSTDDVTTQLILRPSTLAANSDGSEDLTFPKVKATLGELTFSADNLFILPVECTAYLDSSDNASLNFMSYGDKSAL